MTSREIEPTIASRPCGPSSFFSDCQLTEIGFRQPGANPSREPVLVSKSGGCVCEVRPGIGPGAGSELTANLIPWSFSAGKEQALKRLPWNWVQPPILSTRPDQSILVTNFGAYSAGKSTLAEVVEEVCRQRNIPCHVLDEAFLENPVLPNLNAKKGELAADPDNQALRIEVQRLASESEQFFLEEDKEQVKQVKAVLEGPGQLVIQAADLHVDPLYALAYAVQGIMSQADLDRYLDAFQKVAVSMPVPDLILGITVSPERLVLRHRLRAFQDPERAFEQSVPAIEVALQARLAANGLIQMEQQGWPIITIDTNDFNYAGNCDHRASVASLIAQEIVQAASARNLPGFNALDFS